MDVLYRLGRATAAEVHEALPDRPSYSAIRAKLRILEEKGHVQHKEEALRYVYTPTVSPDRARRSALRHLIDTFFNGSVEQVMNALLDPKEVEISGHDLDRISDLIRKAKEEGR